MIRFCGGQLCDDEHALMHSPSFYADDEVYVGAPRKVSPLDDDDDSDY